MYACATPESNAENLLQVTNPKIKESALRGAIKNYDAHSLVIKYGSWVTNNQKQFLRNYFNVSRFQLCSKCSNTSIELWMFDDTIAIEPKKETIHH